MKFNRSAAYKRLQKKLLALRATLPTDERQVLDELIGPEVEAHRLNSKFAQKTVSKTNAKANSKNQEVEAHRLNSKFAQKTVSKANSKTNSKNQEVEAHRFNQRTVQRTASKADPKKSDA